MTPHLLCVGGEDHDRRIPFMRSLVRQGFRVTAAAPTDAAPFLTAGLQHRQFDFARFVHPVADLAAVGTFRELLLDLKPDIVQSFDTKPNLLVPLSRRGLDTPVVRTINGMGWVYSSHRPVALALRPVYQALQRRAARSTAATVFQNRFDHSYFTTRRMADERSSCLIPGSGVDIDGFERAVKMVPPPEILRATLGLSSSDEIVITVTRLTREKGVPTLLKAAELVHRVRPKVRFLLVGPRETEGPMAVPLRDIERHAPFVVALGPRADVPVLLSLADVFAFPTEYREGIPRVLLEAALAEVPIVTSAMPGCEDVVRDSLTGFLVPPGSPRPLAERILDLLRDRVTARRMATRAARLVREYYGLESITRQYVALYDRLLKGGAAARTSASAANLGVV